MFCYVGIISNNRLAEKPERPINHFGSECVACERDTGLASNATLKIRKGGVVSLKTGLVIDAGETTTVREA